MTSIPLNDVDAEAQLINLLLREPAGVDRHEFHMDLLTEDRREIASAIIHLRMAGLEPTPHAIGVKGKNVDLARQCELFTSRGLSIGSWDFLTDLLRDKSIRRKMDSLARQVHKDANEFDGDIGVKLDELESSALRLRLSSEGDTADGSDIAALEAEVKWRLENPGKIRGMRFGMPKMELLLDGLQDGHLVTVAARTSVGKTAFMTSMMRNMLAEGTGAIPGFFSLEMKGLKIQQRLLAAESGVPLTIQNQREASQDEMERLYRGLKALESWKWFYSETQRMSINHIVSQARKLVQTNGVNVIFVDYVQLISVPGAKDERERISAAQGALKSLVAEDLGVPVIVAAQINRDAAPKFNPMQGGVEASRPMLNNLKGSGSLEEDSDVCILLSRQKEDAIADVAKNRDGATGEVDFIFHSESSTYVEEE